MAIGAVEEVLSVIRLAQLVSIASIVRMRFCIYRCAW